MFKICTCWALKLRRTTGNALLSICSTSGINVSKENPSARFTSTRLCTRKTTKSKLLSFAFIWLAHSHPYSSYHHPSFYEVYSKPSVLLTRLLYKLNQTKHTIISAPNPRQQTSCQEIVDITLRPKLVTSVNQRHNVVFCSVASLQSQTLLL